MTSGGGLFVLTPIWISKTLLSRLLALRPMEDAAQLAIDASDSDFGSLNMLARVSKIKSSSELFRPVFIACFFWDFFDCFFRRPSCFSASKFSCCELGELLGSLLGAARRPLVNLENLSRAGKPVGSVVSSVVFRFKILVDESSRVLRSRPSSSATLLPSPILLLGVENNASFMRSKSSAPVLSESSVECSSRF